MVAFLAAPLVLEVQASIFLAAAAGAAQRKPHRQPLVDQPFVVVEAAVLAQASHQAHTRLVELVVHPVIVRGAQAARLAT
jgi:hypothetical protein